MTNEEIAKVQSVIASLTSLIMPNSVPQPTNNVVTNEQEFNLALADSKVNVLYIDPSLVYTKPIVISRPVSLLNATILHNPLVLPKKNDVFPIFKEGITIHASDVHLDGLELRASSSVILDIDGALNSEITQCKIMGDPVSGNKRGIRANGGNMRITYCYVDDIKKIGQDSQAIFTSSMTTPGLFIDNCYLSAAGETFMAGGEDPIDEAHTPNGITITNSTLTKNPAWFAEGQQIKNSFELKNAKNVVVRNCVLEYAGISEGQGAYLFVLTVRNQNGKAPFSTIQNVLVKDCVARFGGGCINFLGVDNNHPSGTMENVTFDNVHFSNIDPQGITKGAGRGFLFGAAPKGITLSNITVEGQNLAAAGYFLKPAPIALHLENIKVPASKYGWKVDGGGGSGVPALQALMPDAIINLTLTDTGSSL